MSWLSAIQSCSQIAVYFLIMDYNLLTNKELWLDVFNDFKEKHQQKKKKIKAYKEIIETNEFQVIALALLNYSYKFSMPLKVEINKFHSSKKKTVYIFNYRDDFVLKVINRLITSSYGYLISPMCHSFQKQKGAKSAFRNILKDREINQKFVLKTDISNYFNSVDINIFMDLLPKEIKDNKLIYWLLKEVLLNENVIFNGNVISEKKGLMAGCPIAPFLSNIYLRDIDEYFRNKQVTYARYSDDLILFDSKEQIGNHLLYIKANFESKRLVINEEKTKEYSPSEKWNFLGFSYKMGVIDVSEASINKLKLKIIRLSKRYLKLYSSDKYTENEIVTMFVHKINKKFYGKSKDVNDLCWTMWYFPLINNSSSLKKIDKFIQDKLRYSVCGRYSKMNYKKVPYVKLHNAGYKPLNRFFYLFKYDFEKFNKIIQD